MRTAGLVTRRQVTLERGIVIMAITEAYGRTYGNLRTAMWLRERRMLAAYYTATGSSAAYYTATGSSTAYYTATGSSGIAILVIWSIK